MPSISAKNLIKFLESKGFRKIRQKGSHVILQKLVPEGTCTVTVPWHDDMAIGTLKSIFKKANISWEDVNRV